MGSAVPVSLAKFKEGYNKELSEDRKDAYAIPKFNNDIRGSAQPADTDALKLWSWYSSSILDADVKASATTFLTDVETEQLVHEGLLSQFQKDLKKAITQDLGSNKVA